ncbi:choice-of-anchor D domain-containing protein [Leptothrix ochracea]|uniref:choice-of-anchor D domain-containing protein n=1 Tax=Leptothrix ochracea TaxID=735331 RepID=UPI0034E2361E
MSKIWNGVSAQAIKNACGVKMVCPSMTDSQYNDLAMYIATARGNAALATCIGGSCNPLPAVTLSATALAFGSVDVARQNAASRTKTITVTNSGQGTLNVTSANLTSGTQFTKVAGADTCTGVAVAPAATCSVGVLFTPTGLGTPVQDTLTLTTNATPTTNVVTMSGQGTNVLAPLSWSSTTVAASNTTVGSTSAALTATLTNVGGPDSASVVVPSLASADFTALTGTCLTVGTLAANASCTLSTTFQPTTAGAKTATLDITTTGQVPGTLTFSGTGLAQVTAGNNAGGGGCTLGGADRPMDPLWVLMLGGAAFVLRRRLPGAKVAR